MNEINLKLKSYDELIFEITKLNTDNYLLKQQLEAYENMRKEAIEIIDLIKPELWNISNKMTYKLIEIKNILNKVGGSDE